MTLRDDIQASLRGVIDSLGETWQYRRLTSGPATHTRTYGSWTDVTVSASSRSDMMEYDEDRRQWTRREAVTVRVSDALSDLHQGDQVKDPAGKVYAMQFVASNALNAGTIAYRCSNDVPIKSEGGNRQGGV